MCVCVCISVWSKGRENTTKTRKKSEKWSKERKRNEKKKRSKHMGTLGPHWVATGCPDDGSPAPRGLARLAPGLGSALAGVSKNDCWRMVSIPYEFHSELRVIWPFLIGFECVGLFSLSFPVLPCRVGAGENDVTDGIGETHPRCSDSIESIYSGMNDYLF